MERTNDGEPISAIQKRIRRQKVKLRNEVHQQRDNTPPDTIGLRENNSKHEKSNTNIHELRDELSDQKLTNQPFLFKNEIGLAGKLVKTITPCKDIESVELEVIEIYVGSFFKIRRFITSVYISKI